MPTKKQAAIGLAIIGIALLCLLCLGLHSGFKGQLWTTEITHTEPSPADYDKLSHDDLVRLLKERDAKIAELWKDLQGIKDGVAYANAVSTIVRQQYEIDELKYLLASCGKPRDTGGGVRRPQQQPQGRREPPYQPPPILEDRPQEKPKKLDPTEGKLASELGFNVPACRNDSDHNVYIVPDVDVSAIDIAFVTNEEQKRGKVQKAIGYVVYCVGREEKLFFNLRIAGDGMVVSEKHPSVEKGALIGYAPQTRIKIMVVEHGKLLTHVVGPRDATYMSEFSSVMITYTPSQVLPRD